MSPIISGGGGGGTVTSVSSANTSIAVANPATTPALTVATLDVLAANGAPAANWSNNSKKITALSNGTAAADAAAFGQLTQLLGVTQYAPSPIVNLDIGSASLTAFDTTNMTVSFTAPLSGAVLVRLTAEIYQSLGSAHVGIALFAHGTSTVVGTVHQYQPGITTSGFWTPSCLAWRISGLTPGAALQYDIAGRTDSGTVRLAAAGLTVPDNVPGGPAVIEVWSA